MCSKDDLFREKNGKLYDVPVHNSAEEFLDAYVAAIKVAKQNKIPCSGD